MLSTHTGGTLTKIKTLGLEKAQKIFLSFIESD